MKATITISLLIPSDIQPIGPWSIEQCIHDYVRHWLEEGYFCTGGVVELPGGIEYQGFNIKVNEQ